MSTSIPHVPRRMLAGLLAGVLVLAGLAAFASPASAADAIRVFGETRVQTSIEIAERAYPTGTDTVLLATSAVAADSLPGNGLAGALDAALLLTEPDELNPDVETALATLDPTTVILLGETAALSQGVEDAVADLGYTTERIGGANRYETSALIAAEIDELADAGGEAIAGGFGGSTTVIVTRGDLPFDAVAASPLSFYGPHPVFLTAPGDLPEIVATGIEAVGADKAVILGGTAAVETDVQTDIETITGNPALRIQGANRNDTAANLATALLDAGFDTSTTYIATGHTERPYDSLTGGQLAGQAGDPSPILLTRADTLSDETTAFLATNAADIDQLVVFGGEVAVPPAVVDEAIAASGGAPETHEVTLSWINENTDDAGTDGSDDTTEFFQGEEDATGSATLNLNPVDDTVSFSLDYSDVTGPFGAAPGFHIHEGAIDENGPIVLFLATGSQLHNDGDQMIEGTITDADAFATPTGEDDVDLAALIDEIQASPDDYYLNVHSDLEPAGAIRGQLPDGGQDQVLPLAPEASEGDTFGGEVLYVDAESDLVVIDDTTGTETNIVGLSYADGDTFQYTGGQSSLADFEQALSVGDVVDSAGTNYSSTITNTFNITTDVAAVPGALSVDSGDVDEEGDNLDATFTWAAPEPAEGLIATYEVGIGTDDSAQGEEACTTVTGLTDVNGGSVVNGDAATATPYSDGDAETMLTVYDLPDETYCAHVRTVSEEGSVSEYNEFVSFDLTTPDTVSPTFTAGGTADAPTFASDEDLDATTLGVGDVTIQADTETISSVAIGLDNRTITVTVSDALEPGESVTLVMDSLADLTGNTGPAADVVNVVIPIP